MAKKKIKRTSRYNAAVIGICIATVIILALDIICLIVSACPNEAGIAIHYETAFLSSGLSIIGLAISVWAILNIVTVLDKSDVDTLKNKLEEIADYAEDHYHNTLLNQFEYCASDQAMAFIAQEFRDTQNIPYMQLTITMQYYLRVFELHHQGQNNVLLQHAADDGIQYIHELLNQDELLRNEKTTLFLHYCLGDLYFYKTYCSTGKESYNMAMKALQEYQHAIQFFHTKLPKYKKIVPETFTPEDIRCTAKISALDSYLCNTLGECYSKAVQGYNRATDDERKQITGIDDLKNKAVFYCTHAVMFSNRENQIYLRNLGCALEAAVNLKTAGEEFWDRIHGLYQDAMHICVTNNEIPYKVFYVWLSLYYKRTGKLLPRYSDEQSCKDLLQGNTAVFEKKFADYSQTAIDYAELAIQRFPGHFVFLKYHAFIMRNLCIYEWKTMLNTKQAEVYFQELLKDWRKLSAVYTEPMWDDFMNELNTWQTALTDTLRPSTEPDETAPQPAAVS